MGALDDVYKQWKDVVMEFTSRSLTYDSDKLPALAGLAAKFQHSIGQISGNQGAYLAGLWKGDLAAQLAWETPVTGKLETWLKENEGYNPEWRAPETDVSFKAIRDRQDQFKKAGARGFVAPSWSWAAIRGPISYFQTSCRVPFRSRIEEVTSGAKMSLEIGDSPYGPLSGGQISLKGYVTHRLVIESMILGYAATENGDRGEKTNLWQDMYLLQDTDGNTIEMEPDDPMGSNFSKLDLSCVFLGSQDVIMEGDEPLVMKGLKKGNAKSWLGEDAKKTHRKWMKKNLPETTEKEEDGESAVNTDTNNDQEEEEEEQPARCREQDPIDHDDPMNEMDAIRFSFYLVLAKSTDPSHLLSTYLPRYLVKHSKCTMFIRH